MKSNANIYRLLFVIKHIPGTPFILFYSEGINLAMKFMNKCVLQFNISLIDTVPMNTFRNVL